MKSGETKLFLGILIVALLLVGVAVWPLMTGPRPPNDGKPIPRDLSRSKMVPPGSHVRGNPQAPYTLVIFSDFQCPLCKKAALAMNELLKQRKDRVQLVFRHFQAAQQHLHSHMLAQAAEAAGQQGKFWEMHDLIFQHGEEYQAMTEAEVKKKLMGFARELKLDPMKFAEALDSKATEQVVDRDQDQGIELNMRVTPTLYLIPPRGQTMEMNQGLVPAMQYMKDDRVWQ